MEIMDGAIRQVDTLLRHEVNRLRSYGWRIGSSTRRYAYNPAPIVRGAFVK